MKPDQYTQLKPYKTSLNEVPKVGGLKAKDGWVNMQVQFLINQKTCNSDKLLVGWTVLPPGAQHDRHRHFNCDEFWIVIEGSGVKPDIEVNDDPALLAKGTDPQLERAIAEVQTMLEKNPPQILLDVQGVGYEVDVPMSTFYNPPDTGDKVVLHTHLVVREDAHLLYGFLRHISHLRDLGVGISRSHQADRFNLCIRET